MALWVLADVINTNQLGADADRVADRLERGHGVTHELLLKNSALAVLLLPLTVLISVSVRVVLAPYLALLSVRWLAWRPNACSTTGCSDDRKPT